MSWNFAEPEIKQHIETAEYGIEKESLRVTPDGRLAQTPHPFFQSNIDRDFCENQVEIISSVHDNAASLFEELEALHRTVNQRLFQMNELLWPFSNPPIVESQEEIPIARFDGELKERESYRRYLANKYGKAKMLYSGIHFNFSFSDVLLRSAFRLSEEDDFRRFKDGVYTELARKLLRSTWLIVYLTASSPTADGSFLRLSGMTDADRYRFASFRCSEVGYWNDFLPILDFSDISAYADSIRRYIDAGLLYAASELYYPLRLKPRGKNSLDALKENGVNHIELRCLDINPLSTVGLFEEDIRFIHLLMLRLMGAEDTPADEREQRAAITNIRSAALFNDAQTKIIYSGRRVNIRKAAAEALEDIERFAEEHAPSFLPAVAFQKGKLSGWRYADFIRCCFKDYISDGLKLAEEYRGQKCACCSGYAPAKKR